MIPMLPRITAVQTERAVKRDGWYEDRQSGSHRIFRHPDKLGRVVIPIHSGRVIPPTTLKTIIDSMGLSIEEFRRLL